MRVDRVNSRKKRAAPTKKRSSARRKIVRQPTDFRSSSWYQAAARAIAIPEDRRLHR